MKHIAVILISIFLMTQPAFALSDINGHKNKKAIEYLQKNNIVQGYADNKFKPSQSISRAEFLKILFLTAEIDISNAPKKCYEDIDGQWYEAYVCYAKAQGWISVTNTRFEADRTITKAEAFKMISNTFDYKKQLVNFFPQFEDNSTVPWAETYIETLNLKGILEEMNETLIHPEALLTRATASEYLYRAYRIKKESIDNFYEIISKEGRSSEHFHSFQKRSIANLKKIFAKPFEEKSHTTLNDALYYASVELEHMPNFTLLTEYKMITPDVFAFIQKVLQHLVSLKPHTSEEDLAYSINLFQVFIVTFHTTLSDNSDLVKEMSQYRIDNDLIETAHIEKTCKFEDEVKLLEVSDECLKASILLIIDDTAKITLEK